MRTTIQNLLSTLLALSLAPAFVDAQGLRLIGITGQQGSEDSDGLGGFLYPDHTLYDLDAFFTDPAFGTPAKLFPVPFVNDSQSIGFCPDNGLLYHTGGSESYSNNPLRNGHDQGGPDIHGVGYQDSQYMESIDLQTRAFTAIFNAAPCPNPDPTLPCFGLVAPRPSWVLPVEQRNSTQTGSEYGARGTNEYHAIRGMAWSALKHLFYATDENGIFKITLGGDSRFVAQPAFPADSANDVCKAILVIPERLLVGHRDAGYLMEVDPESGAVLGQVALKNPPGGGAPEDSFGGLLGLAQHPVTGIIYGIRKTENNFARELVTIDPRTGDTALVGVGNLGLHMAGIAFVGTHDELSPWKLIGITGQQGSEDSDGLGGFLYPDHTLYDLDAFFTDPAFGTPAKLFPVPFVNDSQSIGFCPDNGLLYHTGGSESYSNNPLRNGHDQGGPDIHGVGYQDSQYMESIDLQTRAFTAIFNAAPCPNPDPTLPCFGLVAPRPSWVLPVEQRNSTQTGSEYGARGTNEYHAIRGMAWSALKHLFYATDENGIFKITLGGDSRFVAQPAFPADSANDVCKAILVIPERLLVGHRDAGYLMEVDPESGAVLGQVALKNPPGGGAPEDSFGGLLGLAQHPVTGIIYGIRKTENNFARELVTIDPRTGDTALVGVGNLGLHMAGIAFVQEPPLNIRSIIRNGNNITLTWAGGHPPYQLQASSDLSAGSWSDVGTPTAAFSATVTIEGTARYFRVAGQ